jgi:curved DNA-binding protein CbpA
MEENGSSTRIAGSECRRRQPLGWLRQTDHPTRPRNWWRWCIRGLFFAVTVLSGTSNLPIFPRSSTLTSTLPFSFVLRFFGATTLSAASGWNSLLFVATSAAAEAVNKKSRTSKQDEARNEQDSSSWRDWDYYRILGLNASDSTAITAAEVRQAYRIQAKRYHPDKVLSRTNRSSESLTAGSKETADEVNERFAKIAEAYEVLSNDQSREEYDYHLRLQQQRDAYAGHHHGYGEYQNSNDEHNGFFYESSPSSYQRHDPRYAWDLFDEIMQEWWDPTEAHFASASSYFQQQQQQQRDFHNPHQSNHQHHHHLHPDHLNLHEMQMIREEQTTFIDPSTGWEVLRVAQTFQSSPTAQWRITQDFVEDWDPYSHHWAYRPISEPTIESVPSSWQSSAAYSWSHQQGAAQGSQSEQYQNLPSLLWQDQALVEGSYLEQPPYIATLVDCQLMIVQLPPSDTENINEGATWDADNHELVWSSPPASYHGDTSCRVELLGSRLVVASAATGRIHWSSLPDSEEDDESFYNPSRTPSTYVARLDTDATISVYRLPASVASSDSDEHPRMIWMRLVLLPRLIRLIWPVSSEMPLRGGGFIAGPIQMMMVRTSVVGTNGMETSLILPWQWRCVDSTGPAKCWKLGRLLVRSFKIVDRWVRRILSFLEAFE